MIAITPVGPISPVCCPEDGCLWAVYGIPDRYAAARERHLAEHLTEEHDDTNPSDPAPRKASPVTSSEIMMRPAVRLVSAVDDAIARRDASVQPPADI